MFTRRHLQVDQNVWWARKLLSNLSEFRKRGSNSAEFSTEQTGSRALKQQHYDIWLLFKIKQSTLTQEHKSQKKILQSGTLHVVVFITQSYNCGHEWSCNYHGNSLASRQQLSTVLPRVRLKTQPGVTGRRTAEQNTWSGRNAADTYPVESTAASCSWVRSRLDHVLTTNEPYQSLFGTGPRPPLQRGLGPVVLVLTRVRLMCSHLPKQTAPRVRFNRTKQGRCENALRSTKYFWSFTRKQRLQNSPEQLN